MKFLTYAKTFCFTAVGVAVLWMAWSVHTFNVASQRTMVDTASKLSVSLGNIDTTVTTLNRTLGTVDATIASTRELIATQKEYQDAQNKRFLALMEQGETALINAQILMDDINKNQGKMTEATVAAVNKLTPVLENTAKAAEEASKTISDPKLKESLANIADATKTASEAMKDVQAGTASTAHALSRLDDKVTQMTKPASWIKRVVLTTAGWAASFGANMKELMQ